MKAVALLSGGLDSTVSMLLAKEEAELILALTIDYGQRAARREIEYSSEICREYGITHRVVELPFMKDFYSGLMEDSGLMVDQPWVPNRNGLFLNLAAAFAEDRGAGLVICGFNREEGIDFPDNSREYVQHVNQALSFSTRNGVRVISKVQEMDKVGIVKAAARLGLATDRVWSCYLGGTKPCNTCPSCLRNLEALKKAGIV